MEAEEWANNDIGYGLGRVGHKDRWWEHRAFPLVPQFTTRPGDHYNNPSWYFGWLGLRLWSLDHVTITLEGGVGNGGVFVGAILPYLRIHLWLLPLPDQMFDGLRRKTPCDRVRRGETPA